MPNFRPGFPLPFEEIRDELDRFWSTLTATPAATERPAGGGVPRAEPAQDAVFLGAHGAQRLAEVVREHGEHECRIVV